MVLQRINELILFREETDELLKLFVSLEETLSKEEMSRRSALCLQALTEMAESCGFSGDLWHLALTYILVRGENAYSKACEIRGPVEGSINRMALHDLSIFYELFREDFARVEAIVGRPLRELMQTYRCREDTVKCFGRRIRTRICQLASMLAEAEDPKEMKVLLEQFYQSYGVGRFGLHKAFRVAGGEGETRIEPIDNIAAVTLDELIGYESAKKKLIDNTEAFVSGRPANNCLLFGDAGCGKSSSIKGILNQYYDRGLRIIEIYKHQFRNLNEVIAQIKHRNYRFILFMDDLSFEEFETDYKYLKAVIEGGLEKKPENVLIYATSNRRHLIRENYRDKEDIRQDMHTSDTVQEKLSLAYRFGVTIYFASPDKKEFQNIVLNLARREGITMDEQELYLRANAWELNHGGLSGRTAAQFIDYIKGSVEGLWQ